MMKDAIAGIGLAKGRQPAEKARCHLNAWNHDEFETAAGMVAAVAG